MKLFYELVGLALISACAALLVISAMVGEAGLALLAMAPLGIAALLPQD
jgi:hypothetical protein